MLNDPRINQKKAAVLVAILYLIWSFVGGIFIGFAVYLFETIIKKG